MQVLCRNGEIHLLLQYMKSSVEKQCCGDGGDTAVQM